MSGILSASAALAVVANGAGPAPVLREVSFEPWQRTLRAALVDIDGVTMFEKTLMAVE